jgi:sporulation protein YabP
MEEKRTAGEARLQGMQGGEGVRHALTIVNREQISVQGVRAVESFDDTQIILETEMGTLTLKGEELDIKQLDLESGRFTVHGFISSCIWSTPRQAGRRGKARGLLERLLR